MDDSEEINVTNQPFIDNFEGSELPPQGITPADRRIRKDLLGGSGNDLTQKETEKKTNPVSQEIQNRSPETQASPDHRSEAPELVPFLLPGERILSIKSETLPTPPRPSGLKELRRLLKTNDLKSISEMENSVAALAFEESRGIEYFQSYEALFGRDSLIQADFLFDQFPNFAQATVRTLAGHQGIENHMGSEETGWSLEEKGKIPHEIRDPESLQAKKLTQEKRWLWPYYGGVDETIQYADLLIKCSLRNPTFLSEKYMGRDGKEHTMAESLDAALGWMQQRSSENDQGFIEFRTVNPHHHGNEGWKDSPDVYLRDEGQSYADTTYGVASIEIQALLYKTRMQASELYSNLGQPERATQLKQQAETDRKNIIDAFWIEEGNEGYFGLATERDSENNIHLLKSKSSNMGHAISLLSEHDEESIRKRELLIKSIFSKEGGLLTPYGIRTLSKNEKGFNPYRYHRGAVWSWDTYAISTELFNQGYFGLSNDLDQRILREVDETGMFPEFVNGIDEEIQGQLISDRTVVAIDNSNQFGSFRMEKPPQQVQAWAVAAALGAKYRNNDRYQKVIPLRAVRERDKDFEEEMLKAA